MDHIHWEKDGAGRNGQMGRLTETGLELWKMLNSVGPCNQGNTQGPRISSSCLPAISGDAGTQVKGRQNQSK